MIVKRRVPLSPSKGHVPLDLSLPPEALIRLIPARLTAKLNTTAYSDCWFVITPPKTYFTFVRAGGDLKGRVVNVQLPPAQWNGVSQGTIRDILRFNLTARFPQETDPCPKNSPCCNPWHHPRKYWAGRPRPRPKQKPFPDLPPEPEPTYRPEVIEWIMFHMETGNGPSIAIPLIVTEGYPEDEVKLALAHIPDLPRSWLDYLHPSPKNPFPLA